MATDLLLYAQFKASKAGKTGLTPTIDVWKVAKADLTITQIVTGGSCTEIGRGIYGYRIAAATPLTHDYLGVVMTADATVDDQQIPALRFDYGESRVTEFGYLDAAVSTRLAAASYSAAPSAATVADAVWDETLSGHAGAGSAGVALSAAGSASDPLLNPVGSYVAPQAGYYLQRLANNEVQLVSIFKPEDMSLTYYYGDDYYATDGREQDFTTTYTLTGGTVTLAVRTAVALVELPCSIVDAHTYRLELSADDLETIGVGVWSYDLQMHLPTSTHGITEISGLMMVNADVR